MTSHGPVHVEESNSGLSFMQEGLDLNRDGNIGMRC